MRVLDRLFSVFALVFCFTVCGSAAPVTITDGIIKISTLGSGVTATNVSIKSDSTTIQVNREGPYQVSSIGSVTPAGTTLANAINILQYTYLGGTGGAASGRIIDNGIFNDVRIDSAQSILTNSIILSTLQPFVVPNFSGNSLTTTIPFIMLANFRVSCLNSISCQQADGRNYSLTGDGSADLAFSRDSAGNIVYESATYRFASTPQPTPEPTTILLLGTGLTGIAAYSKRKWRGKRAE